MNYFFFPQSVKAPCVMGRIRQFGEMESAVEEYIIEPTNNLWSYELK